VIEGEHGKLVDGEPGRLGRVVAALDGWQFPHQFGHVDDGHGVAARIAVRAAVGPELAERQPVEARLLGDLADHRQVGVLPVLDETAGQRPGTLEGFLATFNQQDIGSNTAAGPGTANEYRPVHGEGGIPEARSQAAVF